MLRQLWATPLFQRHLIDVDMSELANFALTAKDRDPREVLRAHPIHGMISNAILDLAKPQFDDITIRMNHPYWQIVRKETAQIYKLHTDEHLGEYVAVLWLYGSTNSGGDLDLYDPAFRNPSRVWHYGKDDLESTSHKVTIPFQPMMLLIFPSYVWHANNTYSGDQPKVSYSIGIDLVRAKDHFYDNEREN